MWGRKGMWAIRRVNNRFTYRNKAARAAESLFDGEVEHLTRRCVDMALAGDVQAMRLCVERLLPPVKARPFNFQIPELKTIADAQRALSLIIAGTANGTILSDEAVVLSNIIASFVKTVEISELEARLIALERATAPSPTVEKFDAWRLEAVEEAHRLANAPLSLINVIFVDRNRKPILPSVARGRDFECFRREEEDEETFRARANAEARLANPRGIQILVFMDRL
jgi:hypothetical protein